MALLEISDLHTFYGRIEALKGIDLHVEQGEIVTLIGANGAGKSTLLMSICGRPAASQGKIIYSNVDITKSETHHIARAGIAHAPEGRRIFARMTVLENLQMGAVIAQSASIADDLARILALFPKLEQRIAQRAGTLSGGEQQMLSIGRALMSRPKLLLLDEPSLGLAPLMVKQIFEIIREVNVGFGITVLLVEQNAHHALRLAHRGYVLQTGRVVLSGSAQELLSNSEVRHAYLEGGG